MLCSVVITNEAVEHERSVGENTRQSRVFFPSSWVLYRFLSALQQNRAQSRLLYLFYDKESNNFPTHSAKFSNQTIFSKRVKVTSAVLNNGSAIKEKVHVLIAESISCLIFVHNLGAVTMLFQEAFAGSIPTTDNWSVLDIRKYLSFLLHIMPHLYFHG